jgi:predicted enzyme related to lactoylglutathione lyase
VGAGKEDLVPKNNIQHIEWTTRDPQRLRTFFSRIFDWQFTDAMPGYTMIEGIGGIFAAPDPQMPIGVTPYVNVADLGEKEERIKAAGGQIHKSKHDVAGMGWFTIFSDPDGNMLAMWQSAKQARPAGGQRKTAARKTASGRKTAKKTTGGTARKKKSGSRR